MRGLDLALALARLLVLLFLIAPLLAVVLISFDPREYIAGFPPGFSLRWFEFFINYDVFVKGLSTSLKIATITAVISTSVGLLTSHALTRYRFKGREVLLNVFLSPLIIPEVVTGIALLTYFRSIGLVNSFVNITIGHVIITLPYSIRSISAILEGIDVSLEEAAKSLGAGPFKTFLYITGPLMKPGIIASIVFAFSVSVNDYAVSVFLSDHINYTFSAALFSYLKAAFDPSIAVASILLMGTASIMVVIIDKVVGIERVVGLTTS